MGEVQRQLRNFTGDDKDESGGDEADVSKIFFRKWISEQISERKYELILLAQGSPTERKIIENFTVNEWLLQFRYIIEKSKREKEHANKLKDDGRVK